MGEELYNVNQVKAQFFPGRSTRWIRSTFAGGKYGEVFRDAGGWLIPAGAIEKWREIHRVKRLALRQTQVNNLIQNQ